MAISDSFDPSSAGARHLARTWLPQLERWQVRWNRGSYLSDDGTTVNPGDVTELPANHARQLVESGAAELVGRRWVSAHD